MGWTHCQPQQARAKWSIYWKPFENVSKTSNRVASRKICSSLVTYDREKKFHCQTCIHLAFYSVDLCSCAQTFVGFCFSFFCSISLLSEHEIIGNYRFLFKYVNVVCTPKPRLRNSDGDYLSWKINESLNSRESHSWGFWYSYKMRVAICIIHIFVDCFHYSFMQSANTLFCLLSLVVGTFSSQSKETTN